MATGQFGSTIETVNQGVGQYIGQPHNFDQIQHVSGNVYVSFVAKNATNENYIWTFTCTPAGDIGAAPIQKYLYNVLTLGDAALTHISGTVWAICYRVSSSGSRYTRIQTVNITAAGVITLIADVAITSPEGSTYVMSSISRLLHVGSTTYAIAGLVGSTLVVKAVTISDNGLTISVISSASYTPITTPLYFDMGEAADNVFVLFVHTGSGGVLKALTYAITNAGVISLITAATTVDTTGAGNVYELKACKITPTIWIISYCKSDTGTGRVCTFTVNADGTFGSLIDTDDTVSGSQIRTYTCQCINGLFVLVNRASGANSQASTFAVSGDGTIGAAISSYLGPFNYLYVTTWTGIGNLYLNLYNRSANPYGVWNGSVTVVLPPATIETLGSSDVKHDRATLWGNVTEIGAADAMGIDWSLGAGDFENEVLADAVIPGLFNLEVTGLTYNTSYKYRAKIGIGGTWTYGITQYFTTSYPVPQVSTEIPTDAGDHYIDTVGCLETDGGVASVDKYGFTYGTKTIEDMLGRFDADLDHAYSPDDAKVDGYDETEQVIGSLVAPLLASNAASGQPVVVVTSAVGVSAGLVFKLVDTDNDELLTVDHIVGTTVTMTTNLAHSYTTAKEARLCQVVTIKLRNLEYGKRYYLRFWAHNTYGYGWGSEICALTSDTVNVMIPTATTSKGIRFCIPGKVNFPPSGMYYDTRHHLLVKCPDSYFVNEGAFGWVVGKYVCERQYWSEATNVDLYTMSNAIRRTGTPVKVKYKARIGNNNYGLGQYHKRVINNGASSLTGSYVSSSSILAWLCEIWYDNPWTSNPWSIAETDDLLMGISIRSGTGWEIPLCDCIEGRIIWANAAVTTKYPTTIGLTTAQLHGLVTEDECEDCMVHFEYGTTVAYGSSTTPEAAVKGQHFYASVPFVNDGTYYHCRAVIITACGETFYGADVTYPNGLVLELAFGQSIFTVAPVWTDITAELMELYIKRGRNHLLDKCEAGTAVFTLNNASGNWWRNNTAGAYYGTSGDVKPMTLVRLRYMYNGEYFLYYGVAEGFEPGWLEQRGGFTPISTLSCADIMKCFAKYRIVNANPALTADVTAGEGFAYVADTYGLVEGQTIRLYDDNNTENLIIQQVVPAIKCVIFTTNIVHDYAMGDNAALKKWPAVVSGTRIHDIVLEIGWPLALTTIDTGTVTVIELTPAAGGNNALEELYATTEAEDGNIFIAAAGKLIFHDQDARTVAPYNTSQFTMIDDGTGYGFAHPELSDDDEFIYNEASISGDGIYEQVMVDSTAQAAQGPRAIARKNSQLYNDADAVRQCLMLVLRYKASTMRCKALHVLPDGDPENLYPIILGGELVTRMTLQINSTRNPAVINQQHHIEGLTHRWSPRKGWRTAWQLWETARYRGYNTYHDGFLANNDDTSYAACHDAASASQPAYNDDAAGLNTGQWLIYAGAIFMSARIERGVVEFDTNNILTTETIEEAYILVRAEAIYNTRAWNLRLVSNYTVECPVEQSDYFLLKGAETAHATEIPAEAPAGWKVFEVNALGIANMVKEGITRFGLRSDKDVNASDPGTLSKEYMTLGGKGYYAGKYQMQLIVKIAGS